MALVVHQIDAFTDRPFAGNPAAVVLLRQPAPERWMQQVALEMNLSETAFLEPREDGFGLRWFTPMVEVDLCGHATLASAHFLFGEGHLPPDATARFHSRSGLLTARRDGDWIELDFPAQPATPVDPPEELLAALGVTPVAVSRSPADYLVEVESERAVRDARPDFRRLAAVSARGVMVTSPGAPPHDFVSRFFAPAAGIDEDPVTGSAHCTLGPFWGARLGKTRLLGRQASPRGGEVRVSLAGDRVRLGGQAVTILRGEIDPP